MGWQDDPIISPAPGASQPWEKDPILHAAPGYNPRVANGILDSIEAGFQGSATGLFVRGKLPDVVLDPHHNKWYEKLAASATQMGSELPEMVVGGAAGAAVGGAAGSAVPVVGNVTGAVVGGGAGTFAVPTAIRESLMQAYESQQAVNSSDFLTRASIVLKATGKDALIGALTGGAGKAAKLATPLIGETGAKIAAPLAELGTITVAPAALQGKLPEPEDFANAAILMVGFKAAGLATSRLRNTYSQTGIRPEQVLADAQKDPSIAQDLVAEKPGGATITIPDDQIGKGIKYLDPAPYEDALKSKQFTPFTAKDGREVRLVSAQDPNGEGGRILAFDADGKIVGDLSFDKTEGSNPDVWVDGGWRRQGIASRMYDLAGERGGIIPPVDSEQAMRTEDGIAFRNGREAKQAGATPEEKAAAMAGEIPRAYEDAAQEQRAADIVPGDKAQQVADRPFGPVEQVAGEPAKPTDVNYNYMNTTADAKAALSRLSTVYESEIQTQRRGVVPWEQTQAEAGKWIADIMGSTEPFQPREPGTPAGAAELLARKQILQGAAEDMATKARSFLETPETERTPAQTAEFLASIDRAAMIQGEFLGARAEAGRALNILKETKVDAERAQQVQDLISRFGKDPKQLAEMLSQIDNPAGALAFAKKAVKSSTWEKVIEAWKAGLVSGPVTHVANVMSNLTFAAMRPAVDAVAAGFNAIGGSAEGAHYAEPFARIVGNLQGVMDGLKGAAAAFVTDEPIPGKAESKGAIPGRLGYAVRTPFRLLQAADVLSRSMAESGEAYTIAARQAAKEGLNPLTNEYRERVAELGMSGLSAAQAQFAEKEAARLVFQAPLGDAGKAVQNFVQQWHLEWAVPFIRTPLNIFKEMARLSPAAPIVGEWRASVEKGGVDAQRAFAEMAIGTGISALASSWAMSGNLSGAGDPDPNKRRAAQAAGWQPYSVKINDKWYSYQRLQPVGGLIGMAADMSEAWEYLNSDERDKLPKIIATAFSNAVTSQTFLAGMTTLVQVMADPTRYGPTWINQMAGSVVPAAVGQTAQLIDPYVREVNSAREAIQNRIPGMREQLTPSRDMFGEPVANPDRVGGISPITTKAISDDPVRQEAARLGVGNPEAPKTAHLPSKGDSKIGQIELTPEQRDVFGEEGGHMAHKILSTIMASPGYGNMSDFIKAQMFRQVFEKSNSWGRYKAMPQAELESESQRIISTIQQRMNEPPAAP
jgi:hypothetical protein